MSSMERLKAIVRSLLISCPVRLTISQMLYDYSLFEGHRLEDIIKHYGYSNPELFLRYEMKDVIAIYGFGDSAVLTPIVNARTGHMAKLVNEQKFPRQRRSSNYRNPSQKQAPRSFINTQFRQNITKYKETSVNKRVKNENIANYNETVNNFQSMTLNELPTGRKSKSFYYGSDNSKNKEVGSDKQNENIANYNKTVNNFQSMTLNELPTRSQNKSFHYGSDNSKNKEVGSNKQSFNKANTNNNSSKNLNYNHKKIYSESMILNISVTGSERKCFFVSKSKREIEGNEDVHKEKIHDVQIEANQEAQNEKTKDDDDDKNKTSAKDDLDTCDSIERLTSKVRFCGKVEYDINDNCTSPNEHSNSYEAAKKIYCKYQKSILKQDAFKNNNEETISEYSNVTLTPDSTLLGDKSSTDSDIFKPKNSAIACDSDEAVPEYACNQLLYILDFPAKTVKYGTKIEPPKISNQIKISSVIRIYITEIHNPFRFWFHIEDKSCKLDDLMHNINTFYRNLPYTKEYFFSPELIQPGQLCAALYGNSWHRAEILNSPSSQQVTVFFLDYGTVSIVSIEEIKYLREEFVDLPAFANRGVLAKINPLRLHWSTEASLAFLSLCTDRLLHAKVCEIDEAQRAYYITACDTHEPETIQINRELIERNLAVKSLEWSRSELTGKPRFRHKRENYPTFDMLEAGEYPTLAEIIKMENQKIDYETITDKMIYYPHIINLDENANKSLQQLPYYLLSNNPFKSDIENQLAEEKEEKNIPNKV